MSISLTHLGASIRGLAFAMAQRGRVDGAQVLAAAAADGLAGGLLKPIQPVSAADEVRAEVMAERGIDRVALLRMGPQARFEAEASIEGAAAMRARRAQGAILDIRV